MKNSHRHIGRALFFALALCSLLLILLWGSSGPLAAQGPEDDGSSTREQYLQRWQETVENTSPWLGPGLFDEPCVDGFAGPFPCDGVDLLAWIPLEQLGAVGNPDTMNGNDIWGWTDPEEGTEYVIMGHSSGATFVDITDPVSPTIVGILPPNTPLNFGHLWGDYKIYENTMYKTNESAFEGVQVFDLTELRDATPGTVFTHTTVYEGLGNAHNIAINTDTGYAYPIGATGSDDVECGGSGGLHIIDIQDPLNPTHAGCFNDDGYTHDTQCVIYSGPDPDYQGQEICFNSNEDTVTIVDVTDKANPVQLSRVGYDTAAYTHQGWLTEDQTYFLQDDELDEVQGLVPGTTTYIWDVSDLDDPVLIGTYQPGNTSIDHNLYIIGNVAYEANYRSGLRIVDITDIANANLSQLAFFDTYPEDDIPDFAGAWSVYPFFDSGVLAVGDFTRGLFLLRWTGAPTAVTVGEVNAGSPGVSVSLVLALFGGVTALLVGRQVLKRRQREQ
ncbi:MAG: choice-of-anchor B family protein [Ardenticatenaceae bacterium]